MIVNLKEKKHFQLFKQIGFFLIRFYRFAISKHQLKRLYHDSRQLMKYFRHNYPHFRQDAVGNTFCISCHLCQDVCPTKAIEIKKANLVDFPASLKTGEAPLHFYLDVQKCIKCHLCADVCLVDALNLDAKYEDLKVDLVAISQAEKAALVRENQD